MGSILKGLGSVLIALGIIAIVGTGVILYYNNVAKPEEELVQNDPNAVQNPDGTMQDGTVQQNSTPGTVTPATADTTNDQATATQPADNATPVIYAQPVTNQNAGYGCNHDYREDIVLPASCSGQGVKKRVCKYCGDTITETIPQLSHTPGEPVTVKKPTTTETGLVQITCTVCGKLINSITLDAVADPNKDSKNDANHKHNYTSEVTKKATCTEQGEKTYTCQSCGNTFTAKIPATNHPSRSTVVTEGDCKNPGKIETKCRECNTVVSSVDLTYEHKWGKWETTTPPTETTEGVQTKTCTVCGQTETRSVDKLPQGSGAGGGGGSEGGGTSECAHSWFEERMEPTCVDEGYILYTCTKCGTTKSTTLDPTGRHKYSDYWEEVVEATPEADGYRIKSCLTCGKKYEQVLPQLQLGCMHKITDYVIDQEQSVKPTTQSSGYYVKVCQKCGASYRVYRPKLGS